jgi:hypothetical protein
MKACTAVETIDRNVLHSFGATTYNGTAKIAERKDTAVGMTHVHRGESFLFHRDLLAMMSATICVKLL